MPRRLYMTDISKGHSPWHDGERWLQIKTGVSDEKSVARGNFIRSIMPDQHREFFSQMPFMVFGAVDRQGDPWASFISGHPGFVNSRDNQHLSFAASVDPQDPISSGFSDKASVGLLGIELHTRRRNRLNGKISALQKDEFSIQVDQSFGNCPQYIHRRDYEFTRSPHEHSSEAPIELAPSDARLKSWITAADTFFVSSYADIDGERQVDVSHRGGKPGFVHMDPDFTLTIPDYSGNSFFNTLGNFIKNPKAGLIFPDFETGDVLQLTGAADIILDSPDIENFEGAKRLWTVKPHKIILRPKALPLRWIFKDYSPSVLKRRA